MASSVLTGFSDASGWERCGSMILGRPRDLSYKEIARAGVPIETFIELNAPMASEVVAISTPRPEFFEPLGIRPIVQEAFPEVLGDDVVIASRGRKARKSKKTHKPKHEAKAQKICLSRGKVRQDDTSGPSSHEFFNRENINKMAVDIVYEECWLRYYITDLEAIERRFLDILEEAIRNRTSWTDVETTRLWDKHRTAILSDYKPKEHLRYFDYRTNNIPCWDEEDELRWQERNEVGDRWYF